MAVLLECRRQCGFVVGAQYFASKQRFTAGICPRCSGPVDVVDDRTRDVVVGAGINSDRASGNYGRVTGVQVE